jgi:hypothetical protein
MFLFLGLVFGRVFVIGFLILFYRVAVFGGEIGRMRPVSG